MFKRYTYIVLCALLILMLSSCAPQTKKIEQTASFSISDYMYGSGYNPYDSYFYLIGSDGRLNVFCVN